MERTFALYSPVIGSIKVLRSGKVKRAKLYYLRDRKGKSARISEKIKKTIGMDVSEQISENETLKVDEVPENNLKTNEKTEDSKKVNITIYDLAGFYIHSFNADLFQTGHQISEWVWDVTDVEPGVYFAHVAASDEQGTESRIIKVAVIH